MKVTPTALPGVLLLEPRIFEDERGLFFESFNADDFAEATGVTSSFVQDNHSVSAKGVVRGLHYQLPPHAQGKLVRVIVGAAFDVAVDIRRSSPTLGQWIGLTLSADNRQQLWIPPGFAHGFMALTDKAEFLYKTTAAYAKDSERSIHWRDTHIGIDWPMTGDAVLSAKDEAAPVFADAELFEMSL